MKKFRYKLTLIITILGLVGLISGTSYAVLKGDMTSEKKQVITTGSVKLKLTENFESMSKKITILSDEEGLLQEEVYEFNIKNIGNTPAKYDIKLLNKVPSDYTGEVLSEEYIKVGLEINEEEHGPFSLGEVEKIIDSNEIYENELIKYKLRIWLDEEKQEEIMNLEDYKSFLTIKVEAQQRMETMDKGETTVFNYTGDVQKYMVPRDGWYYVELQGAQGGESSGTQRGGAGALTSGYIELEAGEKLYFYVGGQGSACSDSTNNESAGWNGGGKAGCGSTYAGYGGGGATDVRLVSGNWDNTESLISRIMVAGGGGGGAHRYDLKGGAGGSAWGYDGEYYGEYGTSSSYPDTLSRGGRYFNGGETGTYSSTVNLSGTNGSFGQGGTGGYYASGTTTEGAPGGGGGWYGGGGGQGRLSAAGGGSSYISGYAGASAVEENATTISFTNQTFHYSGKYFVNIDAKTGYNNNGNGSALIKYYGKDKSKRMKNNILEEVRYVRNCVNGNSANTGNHILEMQAIKDGVNIAKGKSASWSQGAENSTYPISNALDGAVTTASYAQGTASVEDCLTVDLGEVYQLDEIAVWHWNGNRGGRAYYTDTYVSKDGTTWTDAIVDEINTTGMAEGFRYNAYHPEYNGYVNTETSLRVWYDGFANTGNTVSRTATTWNDLSQQSNNGTLHGGTWNPTSLSFDGTDDWVDLFYTTWETPTLEVVVTATTNASQASYLFSNMQVGGTGIMLGTLGYFRNETYIAGDYKHSLSTIKNEDGKMYSLSSNYDNHYLRFYGNGINASSTTDYNTKMTLPVNSTHLILGADPSGTTTSGNFFKGNIYSVRFYSRSLTEDEVMHNYRVDQKKFKMYEK